VPAKSALEEKADARRALERGKLKDAIESGLRSTSLDPTDADAWLLLGAAYQSAGKAVDARAAYSTCAKEAKKGEVRECQLMLR
jgi:Flp pilus assembly protein TadD